MTTKQSITVTSDDPAAANPKQCFPIHYAHPVLVSTAQTGWMVASVVSALVLGALAALLVFRFCCRSFWDEDLSEDEERQAVYQKQKSVAARMAWVAVPFHMQKRLKKNRAIQADGGAEIGYGRLLEPKDSMDQNIILGDLDSDEEINEDRQNVKKKQQASLVPPQPALVDIFVQPPSGQATALCDQDQILADSLEKDMLDNRLHLSQALLHTQLNKSLTNVDDQIISDLIDDFLHGIEADEQALEFEMQRIIAKFEETGDLESQKRVRQLKTEFRQRRHMIFKESFDNLRLLLKDETDLTDEQIETICDKLTVNLKELEKVLAENLDQQINFIYKRNLNRKNLLNTLNIHRTNDQEQANETLAAIEKPIKDSHLNKADQDELIKKLKQKLMKLNATNTSTENSALAEEMEKIRKRRSEKLKQMQNRHLDEKKQLLEEAANSNDPVQMLENIQLMMKRHTEERKKLLDELDEDEAERIGQFYKKEMKMKKQKMLEEIEQLVDDMTDADQKAQMKTLKQRMRHEIDDLQRVKELQQSEEEHLAKQQLIEHKKRMRFMLAQHDDALQKISNNTDDVIDRVATAQPLFEQKDKEQILNEHQHNSQLLSSLLKLAKLNRDRDLQRKLIERKAKVNEQVEIKEQKKMKAHQFEEQQRELENQHQEMIDQIKKEIGEETRNLLEAQQSRMADVIGRLQVGHARRQAAIERQSDMVKRLEKLRKKELEVRDKAKEPGKKVDDNKVSNLLNQHRKQVLKLQDKLDEARKRQMDNLQSKFDRIRVEKSKHVNSVYDGEQQKLSEDTQDQSDVLINTNVITSNRSRALEDVQLRTDAEFKSEKGKLNVDLQRELDECLLEQKRQFLDQLANIINMSSEELQTRSRDVSRASSVTDDQPPPKQRPPSKLPPIVPPLLPSTSNKNKISPGSDQTSSGSYELANLTNEKRKSKKSKRRHRRSDKSGSLQETTFPPV